MMISVTNPDPSWLVSLRERKAALWIGPSFNRAPGAEVHLESLILHPWSAVFSDAHPLPLRDLSERNKRIGSLAVRLYEEDAGPDRIPPNRLPIFSLRGTDGSVVPGTTDNPLGLLVRLSMLRRASSDIDLVFVIGIDSDEDALGLRQAQDLSQAFYRLVIVGGTSISASLSPRTESLFHWEGDTEALAAFLADVEIGTTASDANVLVRFPGGVREVDFAHAIDSSYPITASFELIQSRYSLSTPPKTLQLLEQFLTDPAGSWEAYSADIPFPREPKYGESLDKIIERFQKEGPSASITAWIPAQAGAGATTALRQTCLRAARQGYPVLVARPFAKRFDFNQLTAFVTRASDRLGEESASVPELPWIIAFDSEHVQLHWEFLSGLAAGLKKLLKSVIVLAVQQEGTRADTWRRNALGANERLGTALTNTVTNDEAVALGDYMSSLLSSNARRSPSEWRAFAQDSLRRSKDGVQSLFWVALRFWLFNVPGTEQPLRKWLAAIVDQVTGGVLVAYAGLLEVAALSKYRLTTPAPLLLPESARALREMSFDTANPLGIRRVPMGLTDSFVLPHPLLAEELLRIAQESEFALASVEKQGSVALLDLELHVLGRLISRPAAGDRDSIPVIEELVTSGLRVDPREAPRNFLVRDRIVEMLEAAPDALWDSSQVFNHHVAKARRHLATEPPDESWTLEARCEQLAFAEYHLLDAIEEIRPEDQDREESPINLQVSLALTLDARARLEEARGNLLEAEEFRSRAASAYTAAQHIDADNSYVLENFARFKINQARTESTNNSRTQLLVEAISLLQWELKVHAGGREETIYGELARAYDLLEANVGRVWLQSRAEQHDEPACVALARLSLWEDEAANHAEALLQAKSYLDALPYRNRTWRSQSVLYELVSELDVYDFPNRLEILRGLDNDPEFAWPFQMLLDFGILLFQAGGVPDRKHGKDVFQSIRDQLSGRTASIRVPSEMKFLNDPATGYRRRMLTTMTVTNVSYVGRNYFAIPHGWFTIDVPFRAYLFGDDIRVGHERDCFIQFTNFGPQAVPSTTPE